MIVIRAVAVVLAVVQVVFFVVAYKIFEREAVVRRDEVNAGGGVAAVALVEIAAARKAVAELLQLAIVGLPIAARHIAVASIPFGPQRRELAHLIAAFTHIPWFHDEFDLGNYGVLIDDVEECRQPVHIMQF